MKKLEGNRSKAIFRIRIYCLYRNFHVVSILLKYFIYFMIYTLYFITYYKIQKTKKGLFVDVYRFHFIEIGTLM
jgi:hypothetical protein